MASQKLKFNTLFHLLPLVLVGVLVLDTTLVRGRNLETFKKEGSPPSNGTINTIEDDNGDVVDCVDIYKQPAFNHPLLKDHKLQMRPSLSSSELHSNNSAPDFKQTWHTNGICSEGTVPIRRRQLQDTESSSMQGPHAEIASVITLPSTEKRYYGVGGSLSVWKPDVSRAQDYSASVVVVALTSQARMAAGWVVYPELYGDFQPRFFIFWTIDDSVSTGCIDLRCEGFVHVSNEVSLGGAISPVSRVGADTYSLLKVVIFLDRKTGNWWLRAGGKLVGYWPAALFTGIPEGARLVQWAGEVYDSIGSGQHTETDMGNGLFPDTNNASNICSLQYVDSSSTLRTPSRSSLRRYVSSPLCYDVEFLPGLDPDHGLCFLFGGPGRNPNCP